MEQKEEIYQVHAVVSLVGDPVLSGYISQLLTTDFQVDLSSSIAISGPSKILYLLLHQI